MDATGTMRAARAAETERRWPYQGPGQRTMLLAAVMVLVGSVLPWVDTAAGNFLGVEGAGLWTLSAAGMGVAGALFRHRGVVIAHAILLAGTALGFTGWQLLRLFETCSSGGCVPGIGLGITLGGGVASTLALVRIIRRK